jgi:hypothetical protein
VTGLPANAPYGNFFLSAGFKMQNKKRSMSYFNTTPSQNPDNVASKSFAKRANDRLQTYQGTSRNVKIIPVFTA